MNHAHPSNRTDPSEASWQHADRLLSDVAALTRSELPTDEFRQRIVNCLRDGLSAALVRYWAVDTDRQISLGAEVRADTEFRSRPFVTDSLSESVLRTVLQSDECTMECVAAESDGRDSDVSIRWEVLACPVKIERGCVGVLEVVRYAADQSDEPGWSLELLDSVADLCADFHRRRRLEWLDDRLILWQQLERFALRIHRRLDLSEAAFAIVNEGLPFIGCDRLSVVSTDGGTCRVLAVSGVANCDPRSDAVRSLEGLAAAVVASGTPLFCEGPSEGIPPQLRQPLMRYFESSGSKSLAVIPLLSGENSATSPETATAALVAERFTSGVLDAPLRERLELVRRHSATALSNAAILSHIPFSFLFRSSRWQKTVGRTSRVKLVLAGVAGLGLLGSIIPADFEVEARGELQPRIRREIFAPADAVVDELKVDHGDNVTAGDLLAVLRDPQLELESKRVWGELQTARKRLSAVQASRIESASDSATRSNTGSRLSGEEASLLELISNLEQQTRLLEDQQSEMVVRSPISGQILTWDLPQLLQSRPVQRGQILMTVADPQGPWMLELHVPDRRIGHVLDAQKSSNPGIPVSFVLATDPAERHRALIDRIAESVESVQANDPSVLVTVGVDRADVQNPRPGAGATAQIFCGRRSLIYVWLHDVIDAAWSWIRS